MKKILFVALVVFSFNMLNAQNCREIALPYFNNNENMLNACPAEKLDWICAYAHNAFYLTNEIPQGVTVHQLSEVKNVATGEQLADDYVVDLNTLSYYAYDFDQLQFKDYHSTIYFAISNSDYHYLVLRTCQEIYERTEFPQRFDQEK